MDQQDPERLHIKEEHKELWTISEEDDDDEVNLDSGLLDSWAETKNKDEDNQWNEIRTSDSDIKTVNKSFSCPECGKKFLSSSCLVNKKCVRVKQHKDLFGKKSDLNSHTGQKPFSCERCRSFSQKTCLNSHMKVHTGLKPFPCELCGQRFSQKANLNTHLRVHTGQKPFPCELCGQRFSQKSHLNNHMSVHTGKKTFCCQMCGRVFSRKSHLNNHMRIHTGLKPFPCDSHGTEGNTRVLKGNHVVFPWEVLVLYVW
uniref:C2H2-type domain-containing protein n=1 Tax=Nothobranchius furzeri TaxID=105023 RepID=A0A8C6MFT2_NOTFU